jgi:hypothetical protein
MVADRLLAFFDANFAPGFFVSQAQEGRYRIRTAPQLRAASVPFMDIYGSISNHFHVVPSYPNSCLYHRYTSTIKAKRCRIVGTRQVEDGNIVDKAGGACQTDSNRFGLLWGVVYAGESQQSKKPCRKYTKPGFPEISGILTEDPSVGFRGAKTETSVAPSILNVSSRFWA